uniref:Solute carrier family 19, member 1 n=1 Tax=Anisakis simplex TaxID=6269 RepID=A0A0M3KHU4_ANISI
LYLQNTVALWAVLLSSTYFLRSVNLQSDLSAWSSTAMGVSYVFGATTGFFIVERLPRRTLILIFATVGNLLLTLYVLCAVLNPFWESTKYGCVVAFLTFGYVYG